MKIIIYIVTFYFTTSPRSGSFQQVKIKEVEGKNTQYEVITKATNFAQVNHWFEKGQLTRIDVSQEDPTHPSALMPVVEYKK